MGDIIKLCISNLDEYKSLSIKDKISCYIRCVSLNEVRSIFFWAYDRSNIVPDFAYLLNLIKITYPDRIFDIFYRIVKNPEDLQSIIDNYNSFTYVKAKDKKINIYMDRAERYLKYNSNLFVSIDFNFIRSKVLDRSLIILPLSRQMLSDSSNLSNRLKFSDLGLKNELTRSTYLFSVCNYTAPRFGIEFIETISNIIDDEYEFEDNRCKYLFIYESYYDETFNSIRKPLNLKSLHDL